MQNDIFCRLSSMMYWNTLLHAVNQESLRYSDSLNAGGAVFLPPSLFALNVVQYSRVVINPHLIAISLIALAHKH